MNNRFFHPVRADIIRELGKRGIYENKKDETGKVVKTKNQISSSCFGWGPVDDTIPTHKRDLENIRRNLDAVIGQIKTLHYLEKEPSKLIPTGKRDRPIEVELTNANSTKKTKIPNVLQDWHHFISDKFESGSIGFVPECFQNEVTPIDDFVETISGQVVLNFCKFIKMNY